MPVVTGTVTAVFSGILLVIAQIKPSGSTRFLDFNAAGSIIYYHGDRSATIETAEAFCKALGGRLPISLEELSTFALNNPAYKVEEFWLGPVKKVGSVYIWPDGHHLDHTNFKYKEYEPEPISCEYQCCAITGRVIKPKLGQKLLVEPFHEIPCWSLRKPLCVITETPGNTVEVVNESLGEFYNGYKSMTKTVGSIYSDRRKLKIAFDLLKRDLEKNNNLWTELGKSYSVNSEPSIREKENSVKLNPDFLFTNEDSGHQFYFEGKSATHTQAKSICQEIKGTLPVIKNVSDAQFIRNLVGWFRYTWLASQRKQSLFYTWTDGSPVDIPFKSGYPKCQGSCCELALYSADLVDWECNNQGTVVCDVTPSKTDEDNNNNNNNDNDSSMLDEKISLLKKQLSIQKKAMTELIKSFNIFLSNAPATGSIFG